MALNSATYYSNAIVGQMMAGVDVDVTRADAAPKYPVGQGFTRADGNIFRYANVGTATNAGQIVGMTTASGGATYGAAVVVAPASAVAVQAEYPILPGQVGSHYVEVTIASIAVNKYQGGYLIVTRGTGVGETYRIVGSTVTGNPATGNLQIKLSEPIKVALTVSTGLIIVPSIFTDCAVTATTSPQVAGVLMSTTTSTNLWAWVCTRGVVAAAEDNSLAITAGHQLTTSRITAGSYASIVSASTTISTSALASPIIGYSITPAGSSSRVGAIYLQLE
tara:strand:+ start:1617 stop:2450 length:834 start_codon:yes stop_codon:yes gene_type:complete